MKRKLHFIFTFALLLTSVTAWADGLSLTWFSNSGPVTQTVKAGSSITAIVFDYEGIAGFEVTGLPTGLLYNNDTNHKRIVIVGTVDNSVAAGVYDYTVTVWDDASPTPNSLSLSGTITVTENEVIKPTINVTENKTQYVLPGRAIQPIVFTFENVHSFLFENFNHLPGEFQTAEDDVNHTYTVTGTVAANASVGKYRMDVIAYGYTGGTTNSEEVSSNVYVISTSGTCGKTSEDNVTWAVTDEDHDGTLETLTFAGTGDMEDFDSRLWAAFGTDITTVVVGAGVTSIGDGAFAASSIKTIYCLSTTPPTLDTNAFGSCDNLTAIIVPAAAFDSYDGWGPYSSLLTPGYTVTCGTGITATTTNNGPLVQQNETVTLSHGDAPEGYTFSGYSVNGTPIVGNTFTMPASDVTVSATWTPSDNITLTANEANGNYWTTFYCGDANYKIDEGENATAYTAEVSGDNITLHSLNKDIPKNTAVIIKGEDNSISMTKCNDPDLVIPTNDLHGVDVQTTIDDIKTSLGNGTFYVLGNTNSHFGFHKYTGTTMRARKAFLLISGGGSSNFFGIDDETTNIGASLNDKGEMRNDNSFFDLSGRKVENPTKGLYIVNGKKVIIK